MRLPMIGTSNVDHNANPSGFNDVQFNIPPTSATSSLVDTGALPYISNRSDAMKIISKGFDDQLLIDMEEALIRELTKSWELSEMSRAEISVHRTTIVKMQRERDKALDRKPDGPAPTFRSKDIFTWGKEFEQWLQKNNLSKFWYVHLLGACSIAEKDIFVEAKNKGQLLVADTLVANLPLIQHLFYPILPRGEALKKLTQTVPKPGETLRDYVMRYRLTVASVLERIDDWVAAELFVLSLPVHIRDLIHQADVTVTEYTSVEKAIESVTKVLAQYPDRPLIASSQASSSGQSFPRVNPISRFNVKRKFNEMQQAYSSSPNSKLQKSSSSTSEKETGISKGMTVKNPYCTLCKRTNHYAKDCFAKTDIDGREIAGRTTSFNKNGSSVAATSSSSLQSTSKSTINSTTNLSSKSQSSYRPGSSSTTKTVNNVHADETGEEFNESASHAESIEEMGGDVDEVVDLCQYFEQDEIGNVNTLSSVYTTRAQIMQADGWLYVPLKVEETVECVGLIDTGANVSIVNNTWLRSHFPTKAVQRETSVRQRGFSGDTLAVESTRLKLWCSNLKEAIEQKVYIANIDFDFICGLDVLHKFKIGINNIPLPREMPRVKTEPETKVKQDAIISEALFTIEQYPEIGKALDRNEATETLPCCHPQAEVTLEIERSKLKAVRQYPLAEIHKPIVDKQVQDWLKEDIIREATESNVFNSPLWTVPKYNIDGSVDKSTRRVCLDARSLNDAIVNNETYPVPLIKEIFNNLHGSNVYTELDIRMAYCQFPVHPDSQRYLGFSWKNRQYVFNRAIFGLKMMSSKFQKVMKLIMKDIRGVEVYIDNVIVHSKDTKSHVETLVKVIDRLTMYNLTIKRSKCKFGRSHIKLLGHEISVDGVKIDTTKFEPLDNMKTPTTKQQLQSVLGFFNYFRSFLPGYARIAAPLEAQRNQGVITWNEECQAAFDMLRTGIKNADVLVHPDFNKKFYVATDASYSGLGAVLFQFDEIKKKELLVDCISRSLTPTERNYSATKLELAGLVFALERFRHFLLMQPFTVYTDHSALTSLFKAKFERSVLVNGWFETLWDFIDVITIEHRPGIANVLPDILSRTYKVDSQRFINVIVGSMNEDEEVVVMLEDDDGDNVPLGCLEKMRTDSLFSSERTEQQTNESKSNEGRPLLADDNVREIVIDKNRQQQLIKEAHSFGHFAARQVYERLKNDNVEWPGMLKDINVFLDGCSTCQKYKLQRVGFHPLRHLEATYPMEWLCMDLFGPLETTPKGNRFVLVVVDVATKFAWLRALGDKSAVSVAQGLLTLFSEFGIPKIISSDNDGAFLNQIVDEFKKTWSIDQRTTTSYHPRANGLAERTVQTAKHALVRIMDEAKKNVDKDDKSFENWDDYIAIVQYAINTRIHEPSKTMPFELFFGRAIVQMKDYKDVQNKILTEEQIRKHWKVMYQLVYPAIAKARRDSNAQTDKSFSKTHAVQKDAIPNGTLVMKLVDRVKGYETTKFRKSATFQEAYDGPYMIMRKNRIDNYVLKEVSTGNLLERSVPLDKLKILGGVKPVRVIAERCSEGNKCKLLLFNEGSKLWVDWEADILKSIASDEEGVVDHMEYDPNDETGMNA